MVLWNFRRGQHLYLTGQPSRWPLAHILVWHKFASRRHTDGSIEFAKLRQCASLSSIWFPGPPRSTQRPKLHLDPFSRFCTTHGRGSLYSTMRRLFPPQNCPVLRRSEAATNTWLLRPTRVHIRNDIAIGSAVLQGLYNNTILTERQSGIHADWPTDRKTNNATLNVTLAATLWWFTAAPKPLKIRVFWITQPPGVVQPLYSRGHN